VQPFLGVFAKLQVALGFVLSVHLSAWNSSASTGWIFMKFDILALFENLSRKFNFHLNQTRIKGTIHEDHQIFLMISRSFLLRIRNVSDKRCRGNQNTHFYSVTIFKKSCHL